MEIKGTIYLKNPDIDFTNCFVMKLQTCNHFLMVHKIMQFLVFSYKQ